MIIALYKTTVGKKILVALTGIILFGFVIGHMLGNLQIFAGPEKINDYAAFLRSSPGLLWGTRIVLLVAVLVHIMATVQLTRLNRKSRPHNYVEKNYREGSLPSRFMIWSGVFLGAYIVYHLLHMTTGTVHAQFEHADIYHNMVTAFSRWPVSLFYIAGMIALGFHLYHGVWSVFQTLGLNHPKYNPARRTFALWATVLIVAGYISIPVAVLVGVVK